MAKNPKMEFMINLPATVKLVKNFTNGQGEYGPWWGWEVTHEGTAKTMFTDQELQDKIAGYPQGTDLVITKQQIGPKQFAWHVRPDGIEPPPSYQPPPTAIPTQPSNQAAAPPNGRSAPSHVPDAVDRESYRSERVWRAKDALEDALEALNVQIVDENVRALAISFLIDEQHKGITAPSDPHPF